MASGIADISFVSNKANCPAGYKMLTLTNCGHPANLWKKFVGAPAEERYLCFSSDSKDGKIIEDMYIPGSSERYVMKGYEVVKRTIEGDDSLNCKYLAIKRTARSSAKNGIADIGIFKAKDHPPKDYRKLGAKLNGLYICVKIVPVDELTDAAPPTTNTAPPTNKRSSLRNTGSLPVSNQAPPTTGPPPSNTRPLPTAQSVDMQPPLNMGPLPNNTRAPPTTQPPPINTRAPPTTGPPPNTGYPPSTGYTSGGPPYSSGPSNYPPAYSTGAPPTNYPPYSSGAPPRNYPPYSSGAPPRNYPPYSSGAPPTNYPPYSSGAPPTNYPPQQPSSSSGTSRSSQDGAELLLGFEHLDLDQPIEFNQEGEFEDTPPDSPVNEEFTVEESHNLESSAPPNPSYGSSNPPSFPFGGNPIGGGGPVPPYYNNQPRYPPQQQPYPPPQPTGPGQYYPPSQGYPPYNPSAAYRPPPNQGSRNIGFNI